MNYNLVQEAIYETDLYYDPVTEGFIDKVKAGWKWLVSKARELYKKFKQFLKKVYNWIKKVSNNIKKKLMDKINKKFVSESSSFAMESSYFEYEDHFKNKENEMRTMCDKLYKHIEDRYTFIIDIINKLENGIYKNREDFRKDFEIVEYDNWNLCGKFDVCDFRDYNNLWNSISYSTQLWDNPVTKARQDAYNKKWEEYLSLKKSVDEDKKKELYQDMKTLHIQCLNYYLADEKFIYSALSEIEKLEDRVKENLFDKFTERLETSSIGEQLKQLDIYDWDEESLKALLSKRFIRDFNIVIDNGKKACEWPIECIKQYIEYTENLIKN